MAGLAAIIGQAIGSLAASVPEVAGDAAYSGVRAGGASFSLTARMATVPAIDDAFAVEANTATDRKCVKAYVANADWPEQTNPQTGDTFVLPNGETFAVTSVEHKANSVWVIHAREVV